MTNLAKKTEKTMPYERNHIIYGCFHSLPTKDILTLQHANNKAQYKASCLAGIFFGLKLFASSIAGCILASILFQLLDGNHCIIPPFFLLLLWLACAGASFCIGGIFSRLLSAFNRR